LSTSCNTQAQTALQRKVFVLQNKDEDYSSIHSTDTNYEDITQQLAQKLSLPILTQGQFLETLQSLSILPEEQQQQQIRYTHALTVTHYVDGQDILPQHEQYVLAIQPLQWEAVNKKRRRTKPSIQKILLHIKPHWIEFCPFQPDPRSGQPDLLLRAVTPQRGTGGNDGAIIYDLTAGWGQDSLWMALGGAAHVTMIERDPVVACLLQDALRRVHCIAQSSNRHDIGGGGGGKGSWQQRAADLSKKLDLQTGDARDVLKELLHNDTRSKQPDIVYLDPMFPPRTKKAAVKKGMQILHGLFAAANESAFDDADTATQQHIADEAREAEEAELLDLAFRAAKMKVVVKRPINAPTLGNDAFETKPSNVVKGSINRWDIYVKS